MVGGRIMTNTRKHILRSGWVGSASVFVMTLSFLVASIFGGLAVVANLYVNYIESKSNMLVFFNVGMDEELIFELRDEWSTNPNISEIVYLSEEEAFDIYSDYTSKVVPDQYQVLTRFDEKKLPSSLEIKISSLNKIEEVKAVLEKDILEANRGLIILNLEEAPAVEEITEEGNAEDVAVNDNVDAEQPTSEAELPVNSEVVVDEITADSVEEATRDALLEDGVRYRYSDEVNDPPISLIVDSENLETLKDVFFVVRIMGIAALSLLFVFVSIFIFMTVEFRLYNQKDEIGVMQLVGGSLFFIRAPYILEGGFYGMVGSLLSSGFIAGLLYAIFVIYKDSSLTQFLYDNFGQLPWPSIDTIGWIGIVAALAGVGFLLGAVSSYLSIRRYIR